METCLWLNYMAAKVFYGVKEVTAEKDNSRNGKFLEEYQNA